MESVPERIWTWLYSLEKGNFSDSVFAYFLITDPLCFYHTHFLQWESVILSSPCLHRSFRTRLLLLLLSLMVFTPFTSHFPYPQPKMGTAWCWGTPCPSVSWLHTCPVQLDVRSTLQHLSASTTIRSIVINYIIICTFAKMMQKWPQQRKRLIARLLLE